MSTSPHLHMTSHRIPPQRSDPQEAHYIRPSPDTAIRTPYRYCPLPTTHHTVLPTAPQTDSSASNGNKLVLINRLSTGPVCKRLCTEKCALNDQNQILSISDPSTSGYQYLSVRLSGLEAGPEWALGFDVWYGQIRGITGKCPISHTIPGRDLSTLRELHFDNAVKGQPLGHNGPPHIQFQRVRINTEPDIWATKRDSLARRYIA